MLTSKDEHRLWWKVLLGVGVVFTVPVVAWTGMLIIAAPIEAVMLLLTAALMFGAFPTMAVMALLRLRHRPARGRTAS